MKVAVSQVRGLHFEGEGSSRLRVQIDASVTSGGSGYGSSPMELILMALAGSTGMDIVTILDNKDIICERFKIEVQGERGGRHPKVFSDIELTYRFWGKDLPEKILRRAIELSIKKYCSIANMLDKAANITYLLEINPEYAK